MPLSIQTNLKSFQYLEKSYSTVANKISDHFFKQYLICPIAMVGKSCICKQKIVWD